VYPVEVGLITQTPDLKRCGTIEKTLAKLKEPRSTNTSNKVVVLGGDGGVGKSVAAQAVVGAEGLSEWYRSDLSRLISLTSFLPSFLKMLLVPPKVGDRPWLQFYYKGSLRMKALWMNFSHHSN
jgi:hypothetical protein